LKIDYRLLKIDFFSIIVSWLVARTYWAADAAIEAGGGEAGLQRRRLNR